jgi:arylsulfatase A-like enzyme
MAALLFGAALALSSCQSSPAEEETRPNVLLIVFEDMSPRIGAYGDDVAKTPVLDAFAEDAILYEAVFTTAGVCAPSRSSLITGRYQQEIGTQYMRTGSGGPIAYEAVPPPDVKAFPETLRAAGYYTTNQGSFGNSPAKLDYQFGRPFTVWDEDTAEHPWRGRGEGQPFFAMVNILWTHESQTWPLDAEAKHPLVPALLPLLAASREGRVPVVSPEEVDVPPYLPDTPLVRRDIAQHYDNIHYAEREVARLLEQLEEDGLADDTVVIITTDHGDGLPRMKRSLYDSGLRVPLMVRLPSGEGAGSRSEELISFIDFAPTLLALAGVPVPEELPGRVFIGEASEPAPDYVFAAMDRHDAIPDRMRAVRDDRYKYIRNYQTDHPFFRHLRFRDVQPAMAELWRLREAGELNEVQRQYFEAPRPVEELYDTEADPHEVVNLAGDPAHEDVLLRMRAAFDGYMDRTEDLSRVSEDEMIETMWPGGVQPVTAAPEFRRAGGQVILLPQTEGSSIGYRFEGEPGWRLYTGPIEAGDRTIEAKAVRYGYKESEAVSIAPSE